MSTGWIVVFAIIGVLFLPWFAAVAEEIRKPGSDGDGGPETRLGMIASVLVAILLAGWYPIALALGWL